MPNDLDTTNFRGVWPDVLTPLQEDLKIDEAKLCAHLRNLNVKGLEHFVLFGHAGEGASFSTNEKLSAVQRVMTAGVEGQNILLGVHSSSFSEVAQYIHKAYALGVRRFLISAPLYSQPFSHVGLFDYFDALIQHVNLPDWQLFIHQLGGNNRSANLPEATLVELRKAHSHVFVGIVDQDTHVNHTVDLIRMFGTNFAVASCHEPNLSILKPNVCVSAFANVMPKTMQKLMAGEVVSNATQIAGMKVVKPDDRVIELTALLGDYPAIATLKLMLSIHYRMEAWEHVRPPQSKLSLEARNALLAAFKTFSLQANE